VQQKRGRPGSEARAGRTPAVRRRGGGTVVSTLIQAIGFGVVTAAILALGAVAISLQVSVTNFINFAFGDFMTFGAYIAWIAHAHGVPFAAAIPLGCVATGVLGVAANVLIFLPFVRLGVRPVTLLIAGVGLSFILQNGIILIWSAEPQRLNIGLGNALHLGPISLTPGDLVIIGVSATLLVTLHVMLAYTRFGKTLRATSNNLELAQACGIDCERVVNFTWFLAGLLTAIAGVALALEENSLTPTLGFTSLFVIFGAVILGGIGRPYGAMAGALIVGILTEVAGMYFNAAYKSSIAFGFVIVLLLFRPQGLLAAKGKTA
jgi:branched-subunit amino acid ABC-type transport system permease component